MIFEKFWKEWFWEKSKKIASKRNWFELIFFKGIVIPLAKASGGHYYSLIRDQGKWLKFDDCDVAEIELTDEELESQCFGGDQVWFSSPVFGKLFERRKNSNVILGRNLGFETRKLSTWAALVERLLVILWECGRGYKRVDQRYQPGTLGHVRQ